MKKRRLPAALLTAAMLALSLPPAARAAELTYTPAGAYSVSAWRAAAEAVALTGNYAADLVRVALSQVGYREGNCSADLAGTNVFGELNYSEYGRWFGLPDSEWCAMFVSWCARQARIPEDVIENASYATADDFGVRFLPRLSHTPAPGDLIFFDWTINGLNPEEPASAHGDHVGIVMASDDRLVYYIDGNMEDNVAKRCMALDDPNLKGFGVYANSAADRGMAEFMPLTGDCVLCTGGVRDPYDNVRYAVLPFRDVAPGDPVREAVHWAYENAVAAGVTPDRFAPRSPCTRAQTVTFLWRSLGRPAPAGEDPGFTDAEEGAYYGEALAWAVEKGIIRGTAPGVFSPDRPVTRGQVMTILHRLAGSPPAGECGFSDVAETAYYARAVAWAEENGLTAGEDGRFFPDALCLRGQLMLYLYRFFDML